MKTYIVYLNGKEAGTVRATTHNKAEDKARMRYPSSKPEQVSVAYTEL